MKNKLKYLPTLLLTLTTAFAATLLSSASVEADISKNAVVNVLPVCSFTNSESSYETSISMAGGTLENTESLIRPTFDVSCNSTNGFSVNAIGFSPNTSGGTGVDGNTNMYGEYGNIATGTSGTASYWSFKVTSASASANSSATIQPNGVGSNTYATYSNIPSSTTPIVNYAGPTTPGYVTGSVRTDYQVYANPGQPAGTYTGMVKYTMVVNS